MYNTPITQPPTPTSNGEDTILPVCTELIKIRNAIAVLESQEAELKAKIQGLAIRPNSEGVESLLGGVSDFKFTCEGRVVTLAYDYTSKNKINLQTLEKLVNADVFSSMISVTQKDVISRAGKAVLDRCLESTISDKKAFSISIK